MKKKPNIKNASLGEVGLWYPRSKAHKITNRIGLKFCKRFIRVTTKLFKSLQAKEQNLKKLKILLKWNFSTKLLTKFHLTSQNKTLIKITYKLYYLIAFNKFSAL